MIYSNPPTVPDLTSKIKKRSAGDWNINGQGGRVINDALITQGRYFLKVGGEILFTTTSKNILNIGLKMQTAIHLQAQVKSQGTIEIENLSIPSGTIVDVFIISPKTIQTGLNVLDIIDSTPGQRLFKTAEEVQHYLKAERNAWEV